jgi:ABC-type transport system substrate-binding protein
MSQRISPYSIYRLLMFGLLLSWIALAGGWASGQTGPKKPSKPVTKKEEEEDPSKARPNVPPPRVGDEDMDEKSSKGTTGELQQTPLDREAQQASHADVKKLFTMLAKPHDRVALASAPRNFEPVSQFVGPKSKATGSITLRKYSDTWQLGPPLTVQAREIRYFEPYENIALVQVDNFLKSGLDQLPETDLKRLPRADMLAAAEKALTAVIRFHQAARERGARTGGEEWKESETNLTAKLQWVRLEELRLLTSAQDWEKAFEFAIHLAEDYPRDEKVQVGVTRLLAEQAKQSIQNENFREARKRLLLLEDQFPESKALAPVREELKARATQIVQEAQKLAASGKAEEAIGRLHMAEEIYPKLPLLHETFAKLRFTKSTLYVGVAELPRQMSPALARTDSEKQAVELLFESLVRCTVNASSGQRYEPRLASEMPKLITLGRYFTLTRDAFWSDGRRVTAADVRRTISLLNDPQVGATVEGDALHVALTMRQGFIDPLSLMDFKILPERGLEKADDAHFAQDPIGSGPYRFKGFENDQAVFIANPYYGARSTTSALPLIREIHFLHSKEPAKDFQDRGLHLLLDLPTRKFKELKSAGDFIKLKTMQNRRIYFLAVNHHHKLQKVSLRRAIAHAIDRVSILNQCFREGDSSLHRSLNGPYPPGSWACDPRTPPELFRPDLAKAQADIARNERAIPVKLTLKYPKISQDDDPAVVNACGIIKQELSELGIEVELVPCSPHELHQDVEGAERNYDLAYYYYDYPSEAYWLWPLMGSDGKNCLGYKDSILDGLFGQAMIHRQISAMQDLTHQIHARMYDQMPMIPLWQLDTHIAIHKDLEIPENIDPLLIFNDVETWKLQQQR